MSSAPQKQQKYRHTTSAVTCPNNDMKLGLGLGSIYTPDTHGFFRSVANKITGNTQLPRGPFIHERNKLTKKRGQKKNTIGTLFDDPDRFFLDSHSHRRVYLYHGTPCTNAPDILSNGFRTDKVTNGRVYGNGVYLTSDYKLATRYASTTRSFQRCVVVVSIRTDLTYRFVPNASNKDKNVVLTMLQDARTQTSSSTPVDVYVSHLSNRPGQCEDAFVVLPKDIKVEGVLVWTSSHTQPLFYTDTKQLQHLLDQPPVTQSPKTTFRPRLSPKHNLSTAKITAFLSLGTALLTGLSLTAIFLSSRKK